MTSEEYYQCIFLIEVIVMQMICYVFVSRCHAVYKKGTRQVRAMTTEEKELSNIFVTETGPLDTNIQRVV